MDSGTQETGSLVYFSAVPSRAFWKTVLVVVVVATVVEHSWYSWIYSSRVGETSDWVRDRKVWALRSKRDERVGTNGMIAIAV